MPRLKGLDHVGLMVTDMDKSLDFYRRLGLAVLRTSGPSPDGVRTAVLQVGASELNVFSNPNVVSSGENNPIGMDHFCLLADAASIDDIVADLRAAGIDVVRGPV